METNWRKLDPNSPPSSRSDLLNTLSNIQEILIRATHSRHTMQTFLSDVSLDTAVSQHTGQGIATAVEVCRCPPGYKGTSCEVNNLCFINGLCNLYKMCFC